MAMDKPPQNAIGYVRLSELRLDDDLDELGDLGGPGGAADASTGDGTGSGTGADGGAGRKGRKRRGKDGRSNRDQGEAIREYAARLGWGVGKVIVENDLVSGKGKSRNASAFKRRKIRLPNGREEWRVVRPGFRQALDLLADGEHDGFVALDLDRAVRDPRDLEDMIDVAEQYRVPVETVNGSLRLNNDADITNARVLVAMANKASRDTARRVSRARKLQAVNGEFGGGPRPYGFDPDGVTGRADEAAVILECSNRLVQGASLRELAADLRRRGIPTATGLDWTGEALREVLLRPRNAGFMVYKGEEIAKAPWEPIVPVETFRAVQAILNDPDRRTGPGPAPKWLGSGLYRCGACAADPTSKRNGDKGNGGKGKGPDVRVEVRLGGRQPAYRCKERNHLVRSVKHVDSFVVGLIVARLSRPDAADLFITPAPEVDVAGLRAEADAIRVRLNEMAEDRVNGLITKAQMLTATAKGNARLADIEQTLQAAIVETPLSPLIGANDVQAVWDELPLSHQRLVVDALMTVTILPAGRHGRGFNPDTVAIDWK